MKRRIALALSATLLFALVAGCSQATEEASSAPASEAPAESMAAESGSSEAMSEGGEASTEGMKVALLLPGSANDQSWNQYGYEALMAVEEQLGAEVAYSENVQTIDLQQALRDYASQDYDVIFGHTGSFEDDMISVGEEFPDTNFVVIAGGTGGGDNVFAVDTAPWQYGYAYGWMAGSVTESGKVGYITANEGTSTQNNLVGGWKDGVKQANPDAEATVVYLEDGDDVAAAREAALALAASGCDVIMHELNRGAQGVMDVAQEEGIYTIGRSLEDMEYNPDYQLAFAEFDWSPKYVNIVERIAAGEMEPGASFFGFHTEPDAPGFVFTYDDANEWNPNVVTPEILEAFNTEVVEMFQADPIRTYTTEDAAGGTF